MKISYRPLGRTGLMVSPLCLGTMNFGPQTSEADSFSIMDKALELGLNFFDTANVYGGKPGEGVTEKILGRWFEQGGGRREKVVLATKVYGPMAPEGQSDPNLDRKGLSARKIIVACEASLRRLKTDHIELYQMHHVDRRAPWDEVWQAMEQLIGQGKVIYIGSSNFAGWDIATANQIAARRNFLGLVSEQSVYSLVNRMVELEVLPACQHYGLGLIPYSPLAGGLLGGALTRPNQGRRAQQKIENRVQILRPQLDRYETLCKDLGQRPANVAITWLLRHPAVTAPIIGPRTMDQLTGILPSLDLELDPATLEQLDEIWPGPGGEAPEAYAW